MLEAKKTVQEICERKKMLPDLIRDIYKIAKQESIRIIASLVSVKNE